ncbi:tRNA-splicing ligase RtcB [Natronincola peptidivorans]|uniref:3'-phosphate/5'-hydroxy nucleic acid ligase n=1 Tax=Natronincola peptidivorans TaxID=426128 RepID=A0A1I0BSF1_9FIRM|nr:RtcB family protein [Natronincola peptidivorans]SET09647.1 tRNA-splicing ligase RtcB [Natronincola peptidivorans]
MRIMESEGIPIKIWATEIDEGAIQQAINLSKLTFAYSHIALMADAHEGYGMPIGGVLATEEMIIPNAVGVDIGCGVVAIKTDKQELNRKSTEEILNKTSQRVPMGFKRHKKPQNWQGFKKIPDSRIIKQELTSARKQLGTLGGGNHFCSIEMGSDGFIWLMVHSGSRNLGLKVANYYNTLAKKLNVKYNIVPPKYDLASLSIDSPEGREYFAAMEFCLAFARANRQAIADAFYDAFAEETKSQEILQQIDIHHNYAAMEKHFQKQVVLHRKGATSARKGELGIIPGSMGTPSYIVAGLGNPESFQSCSHGAGRAVSRKKANQIITEEAANKAMEGILFKGWRGDYSEAPMAYKDIEEVMANQKDLVKPLVKLTPLGVIKG